MKMTAAKCARIDTMSMEQFALLPRTVQRDYLKAPMPPDRIHAIMRKLSQAARRMAPQ